MILHLDQEGNDCIRKLRYHCIQILHSDIYSVPMYFFEILALKRYEKVYNHKKKLAKMTECRTAICDLT